MGLRSKIKSFFLSKKSQSTFRLTDTNYTYFFQGLKYNYNEANFSEFTLNGYGRNPYVYAVVDKISDVASSLPRSLTDDEGGDIAISMESLAFQTLLLKPNYIDSQDEFYHKIFSELLVNGNAIIYSNDPFAMNETGELWVARSSDVTINTINGKEWGRPRSYSIDQVGTIDAEDVLHLRFPNITKNTNWGLSPLQSGQAVYAASNDTFEAKAHIHKNRGVSGILSSKDANVPMLPKDQEKLQKDWNSRTAGADKFGTVHVTNAALNFLDIGMSPKDLALIEHNVEALRDVCRIYGVDSSLFGDPQNRTYSNQEQAIEGFYRDVVLPLSIKVDKKITSWLLNDKFGVEGKWGIDKNMIPVLNRPDADLSIKVVSEVNAGILTAEEAKEILYPEL